MTCEEKIHVIIVDEFIHVRDNRFWNNTSFDAPPMPAFAMEAARRLLSFAKDHIGPSMVTKVSAWAASQSLFGSLPRCASGSAYTLVHMTAKQKAGLLPIGCRLLHVACCLLPVGHCLLSNACCMLPVVYCLLAVAVVYCLLSIGCCMLSVVYCMLSIVYCLLAVGCCLLPIACCLLAIVYWLLSVVYWLLAVVACCLLSIVY
jgi:hypothetical protein